MPTYIFDDVFGDQRPGANTALPVYLPQTFAQWDPVGGTCSQCTLTTNLPIPIDPTKAQNGTWHTVTVNPSEPPTNVSFTFIGTGVSAYCMLPPVFGRGITSYMNMTFDLDGSNVGFFEKTAVTEKWTYNFSVYSTSGLENTAHTFAIQPRGGESSSYLVFDYFTYDYQDIPEPIQQSSASSTEETTSGHLQSTALSLTINMPHPITSLPARSSTITSVASASRSSSRSGMIVTLQSSIVSTLAASNVALSGDQGKHLAVPRTTVAGAVAGCVAFLVVALLFLWFSSRRKRIRKSKQAGPEPYTSAMQDSDQRSGLERGRRSLLYVTAEVSLGTATARDTSTEVLQPITTDDYLARPRARMQEKIFTEGERRKDTEISRLQGEAEILRAERDELRAALDRLGRFDELSQHSTALPTYQHATGTRSNDASIL